MILLIALILFSSLGAEIGCLSSCNKPVQCNCSCKDHNIIDGVCSKCGHRGDVHRGNSAKEASNKTDEHFRKVISRIKPR